MTSSPTEPRRGEIWLVNFDPQTGSEIAKVRPALVISADGLGKLPLRIVVPITDWKPVYQKLPWFTLIEPQALNGLSKISGADAFQCKSVSLARFKRQLGQLSSEQVESIVSSLAICVGVRSSQVRPTE